MRQSNQTAADANKEVVRGLFDAINTGLA